MKEKLRFETIAIKKTTGSFEESKPVSQPICLSTTFFRKEDGDYTNNYQYTRGDNPNRRLLEAAIAELDQGAVGIAFASGMAAISAILQSLKPGDHIILPDDVYYNVNTMMAGIYTRWGLAYSVVDMSNPVNVSDAIQDNTALIWAETPSNPQLKLTDIAAIAQIAKANNALLAVDNTWPTPVLQTPLQLGADITVYSTTKYFGGHSDVLGGCVVCKNDDDTAKRIRETQQVIGAVPAPFDCWLVARGLQTMSLRVNAQCQSANKLAEYLSQHPSIEKVNYPGLVTHPQHRVALKQMPQGFGAMLSLTVKGDAQHAIDIANKLQLFATATSLGGVESLVEHRKSLEGPNSPTPDNLLRLSIGLEHIDDLINDWDQALLK